jgi:sterol desaturase/sphingolipid hydroxylase (fatty acid hydroxylase superfamily)
VDVLIYYAVPLFLLLLYLEIGWCRRHPGRVRGYERRDTRASLAMGVGNVVISLFTRLGVVAVFGWLHQYALFDLGRSAWAWGFALLADDFAYYWFHRLHHEVRFLWAAHENHHSSRHFNLSTALRQPWTTPITGPIFWAPLALLGIEPVMIATCQAISLIYQYWIHTEAIGRLGPLEWILNTPSHHRVHHGRNVEYLDRNHGGILIVWDRLFGSFEPERAPCDYGLTKQLDSFNPLRIAFHEWIAMGRDVLRARRLREALGYVFLAPGWSPDGSTLTARQLRAQRLPQARP